MNKNTDKSEITERWKRLFKIQAAIIALLLMTIYACHTLSTSRRSDGDPPKIQEQR